MTRMTLAAARGEHLLTSITAKLDACGQDPVSAACQATVLAPQTYSLTSPHCPQTPPQVTRALQEGFMEHDVWLQVYGLQSLATPHTASLVLTRGLLCHRRMRRCSVVMTTVAALPQHSSYRQPTCSSPTAVCLPFWLPSVMYLLVCS